MIDHIEIKKLMSADFDGQASQEEKAFIEEHLKECAECRAYSRQLQKLSATLTTWETQDLSPDLEHKIHKGLKEVTMSRAKKPLGQRPLFRVGVGGGGVLVAILVLVISMQTYSQRALQGRLKSARDDIGSQFYPGNTNAVQYQPYYLETNYQIERDEGGIATLQDDASRGGEKKEVRITRKTETTAERMNSKVMNINQTFWGGDTTSSPHATAESTALARTQGGYQVSAYETGAMTNGIMLGSAKNVIPESDLIYRPQEYPYDPYRQDTEQYDRIYENKFLTVGENPLSTLSIDVDTASYSNMRRFLNSNRLPPEDAVRIEEMINYFSYDYPNPQGEHPFSITTRASVCPWKTDHQLVQIGIQGKTLEEGEIRPSNLVFLIDVSGSMNQPNKLPLLKTAFKMMVNQLGDNERVAIVVYAGAAGKVLDSTPGSNKQAIIQAIDNLSAGGSTAGGAGIKLAYKIARDNFIKEGNNRVILATDGDFNVGASSNAEMVRLIEEERKAGTFLTVLGFGTGNYKDSRMEQIADKGNGNYYYIDTQREAKKVLVSELGSTLFTIAKDVKIQIEFNPAKIKAYRLIGYENRILAKEDFNDDTKDAGELGAGHTVTALYEIVPAGAEETFGDVDELVYQKAQPVQSGDLMTVKLRYKKPDGDVSKLIKQVITETSVAAEPTGDFQFATAVAEFGLLLRNSQFKGESSYQDVLIRARNSKGKDSYGYRQEFIDLVEKAQLLDTRSLDAPGINFKGQ